MPSYRIKYLTADGEMDEVRATYASPVELRRDIQKKNQLLIDFREDERRMARLLKRGGRLRRMIQSDRINEEALYNLFYQLGIMLKAGVPVVRALKMASADADHPGVRKFLHTLEERVRGGESFSRILERMEDRRFRAIVPIVKMGERTGRLWESFLKIARNSERWVRIRNQITNAFIYPLLLLGTGLLAMYVILVYVIPQFQDIITNFNVVLPLHTRLLFSFSLFFKRYQVLITLAIILLLIGLFVMLRSPGFRKRLEAWSHAVPLFRRFKFSTETLRFLNSLSSLLGGGVPIIQAFELSAEFFSSPSARRQLAEVRNALNKGEPLGHALARAALFPVMISDMVTIGEESGKLVEVLEELYEYHSNRYLNRIKKVMNILEPLIIMLVAVFIAAVVFSVVPAILSLSDINF